MIEILQYIGLVLLYGVLLLSNLSIFIGIPGGWISLVIIFLFDLATKFSVVGWKLIVIMIALMVIGEIIESFLGVYYVHKRGASRWGVLGAFLGGLGGAIVGTMIIPVVGSVLFNQNPLVYLAYLLVPISCFFLGKTRYGLELRAIGENPAAADTVGINVSRLRYFYTFIGGALAGLGGAYLSLAYTPGWKEQMTGGQGWIAIALVIFAMWDPLKAVAGALLFGFINAFQFYCQAAGLTIIPSYILRMLPYLFTIGVLVIITKWEAAKRKVGAPAALGIPFEREQ